jgi:lipopolysaccharide export LptBFGC system permease protein LptF
VENLNWLDGTADNVRIYAYGEGNDLLLRICASGASYRDGVWTFENVREWAEDAILSSRQPPPNMGKAYPQFTESPLLLHLSQQKLHRLSPGELELIIGNMALGDPGRIPYAMRLYTILADCWSPPVALLCALPFSLTGSRRGPFIAVSRAIACLFLFHLLRALCHFWGASSQISPAAAAILPFAIALPLGIFFLFRRV